MYDLQNKMNELLLIDLVNWLKVEEHKPSICIVFVFSDCVVVTVSVSILRACIVGGGRQLISQTLRRIPLTDVDAPVASRKYAANVRKKHTAEKSG